VKLALALPAFLPDMDDGAGLDVCDNAYPKADGYGPVMGAVDFSSALPATFAGGASFVDYTGTSHLVAGTTNGLELFDAGTWDNLLTGLSVTQWRFTQFGDYGIAVNGISTKVIDLQASTAATLTGAPAGQFTGLVGDYLIIANVGADEKNYVYNSGFNDHTVWTVGEQGSGFQPMLTGGEIMGFAGGEFGVILQRTRLVRMSLTGEDKTPFAYDEITPNVGCVSKASVAQYGRWVFFLSDSGFMALVDGQEPIPIGQDQVDEWFARRVSQEEYERLWTAIDPANNLVIWAVPGNPGLLLKYHFERKRWSTSTLRFDAMFFGLAAPTTLEELAVTYTNIDTIPYSLDDDRFRGGLKLFLVTDRIVQTLTGPSLGATFGFGFGEYGNGAVSRLTAIRPITDGLSGQMITVDCRQRIGDAGVVRNTASLRASGLMPIRARGKYMKLTWSFAPGATWTYAKGMELQLEPAGER